MTELCDNPWRLVPGCLFSKTVPVCYLNLHIDCVLRWGLQTLGIKILRTKSRVQ